MNNKSIDLAPFLGEIENIINNISHDRLKKNVIAYARDLAPAKRFEFLQIIALDDESFDDKTQEDYETDNELLNEATAYYKNILKGAYSHDLDINNPDDVPDWVDDMDILFDRADEAFLFEDRELAGKVYEVLFDALHVAEEIAVEHQLYSAQDMVITDVSQAKARYFRSVYEGTALKDRPAKLLEAVKKNFPIGHSRIGLMDMKEACPTDLEDFDKFLSSWIELLKNDKGEDDFEIRLRNWLLREAVYLKDGFKGLETLADEQGENHPEIYYDLVAYYVKANKLKEAEDAARKGISEILVTHQKAVLADWLAELEDKDGNKKKAIDARKEAWRYEPTQERLVNWFNTSEGILSNDDLEEEVKFLRKEANQKYVRLICMLELLIGEYDLPTKALITADPLGWRPESHPGEIVLPFLLIGGGDIKDIPENSSLKFVSEEMKSIFIRWQAHLISGSKSQELHTYLDYLQEAIVAHPIADDKKDVFMATARTAILDRIRAVVTQGLDHLFPSVAHLAVAFAEACYLSGQEDRGLKLINNIRNMYIRQNNLRNEIRTQFNLSPILPSLTLQGQLTT
ncbi:MAG: hypothetical protein MK132_26665 [Lentisphaerales bacterium]|nr:hypothetical protein [Lentisphaerales bacterium]